MISGIDSLRETLSLMDIDDVLSGQYVHHILGGDENECSNEKSQSIDEKEID